MVAAAHPLATEAGLRVLRAGGSAVDAAIAVQMVLTLVEPQSSGIGGGGFMLTWDLEKVQAWDGRETAPTAAHESLFLDPRSRVPSRTESIFGGRPVATPGLLPMLEMAHRQHGRLAWARLFEPAIDLAERGAPMGPRLRHLLAIDPLIRQDTQARSLYFDERGEVHPVGYRVRNPALAAVLRQVADQGASGLHEGPVAAAIVRAVQGHPVPGGLSLEDLRHYQPLLREPLCTRWRERWRVCGFPPPSSGHLTTMQILGLLPTMERHEALRDGVPTAAWLHAYQEASSLAMADRAQHIADPAFAPAPGGRWDCLLEPAYLSERAALMGVHQATDPRRISAGLPRHGGCRLESPRSQAPMAEQPERGTSHITIIDDRGHAVVLTSSVEAAFGSRLMVDGGTGLPGGFFLNNHMTDFALQPRDAQGRPVANRIEPGKRPRSSMAPTFVFDEQDGRLHLATGSPGGGMIIHFNAKMLLATLDWGLDVQAAIELPNFAQLTGPLWLEQGRFTPETIQALRQRGHVVEARDLTSGIQAIERRAGGWFGGADPRREGTVRAD